MTEDIKEVIPQDEWEVYIAIRDRMSELEDLPADDDEYDKEYGRLQQELHKFEKYGDLNERYKLSVLSKAEEDRATNAADKASSIKYGF